MKYLYKYPQAEYPVRSGSSRRTGGGREHDPEYELVDTGIFDEGRYFDVVVEYAKRAARGHADSHQHHQPRAGGGADSTCCRRSGSATPGRWGRDDAGRRSSRPDATVRRTAARAPSGQTLAARRIHPLLRRRRRIAVHRERNQHRSGCSARRRRRRTSRTRSTSTSSHGRREAVNPAATARRRRRCYARTSAPGETVTLELRLARRWTGRIRSSTPFADFDALMAQRREEADEFYDAVLPATPVRRRAAGGAAGLRRHAVVEAVLPLRRHRLAGRRPGRAAAARDAAERAQPRVAALLHSRRDLDARQVGVSLVRLLGPGVSLRRRWRTSTRSSPRSRSS